jgi:uncharacterized membrane protein (DUF106 family)
VSPDSGRPLPSGGAGAAPSTTGAGSEDEPEPASVHPGSTFDAEEETGDEEEGEDDEEPDEEEEEEEAGKDATGKPLVSTGDAMFPGKKGRGPEETKKSVIRFVLLFLGFLGLFMLIDPSCWSNPPASTCSRLEVANALGALLAPGLGFGGYHLLATMFLAAAVEMLASALAYHITTDWIEAARVAKHGQAIRPLWMKALRSQKKDHIAALKPHMDALNSRQSRVTINQFKGMVITWVLLIAIYTWVGIFITAQCPAVSLVTPSAAAPVGTPVWVNSTVTSGHTPYSFSWWAQLSGTTIVGPVSTYGAPDWSYSYPQPGVYTVTLEVSDARGNVAIVQGTVEICSGATCTATATPLLRPAVDPNPLVSAPPAVPSSKGCAASTVNFFGASTNLLASVGPFPLWFLAFSLYTFPLNLIFRRYLKHSKLVHELQKYPASPPAEGASTPSGSP